MTDDNDSLMTIDHVYSAPNPHVVSSEGIYLWDRDGRRYLDGEACNGGSLLGYDHSIIDAAARNLAKLPAAPSFVETDVRMRLGRRLRKIFEPAGTQSGRVIFDTSGASAIETAVKLAGNYLGDHQVFVLAGAYHGRSMYTSALSSSFRYRQTSSISSYPVVRLPTVSSDAGAESVAHSTSIAVQLISAELWGGTHSPGYRGRRIRPILIVEAFQNVGGGNLLSYNYLRAICKQVQDAGGLVIADETFTGIYRTGPLWSYMPAEIFPDIVVGCKALSNSMAPFSCIWAANHVSHPETAQPGLQSATFASCALTLGIVHAVLDKIDEIGLKGLGEKAMHLQQKFATIGQQLKAECPTIIRSHSAIGAILKLQLNGPQAHRVRHKLLTAENDRLLVSSTGLAPDTILVHPSLLVSDHEIDAMYGLLRVALRNDEL
ncbi:aminotransferase class III-fold pyridoxal phosphate-dependent enzyme [Rhodococcus sp. P1Y]|uniref:aminotransferase class III-fold pyridoxal phosphate-dependent enzyme n=1 Tax=Rhodococcus sp. P1Y TaxID=1302308 RepID=UPI00137AA30D|nr:aminotransferase class III-fold pyridoxal phosphate-dependent enzyme [Rhodococcus sp. P1Y]